ncbi:protein CASPARIAN STRIP INTEGRITY FACTOR 1-like isoform X1 [Juglans microcarpa x Juglans regia]|uniref:protein CASPARIAN STRIP INTEGRITY FACTOR 1-like isoform X1 n=1 Tax=Juglans microcarpa x Juglans regia TaxID=2249226 RepID=UPI0008DCCD8B|nr:protein CASPARIAN STRIP INTEGRITY FACTOR 1-like isoform X1 [Juglans microcarpa x Juglans regia]
MGLILLKKLSILFLILASLLSACIAGGQSKFFNELAKEADTMNEGIPVQKPSRHDEEDSIHERLLRVNTKDYGRYDPAPALVKPPFKLIPN